MGCCSFLTTLSYSTHVSIDILFVHTMCSIRSEHYLVVISLPAVLCCHEHKVSGRAISKALRQYATVSAVTTTAGYFLASRLGLITLDPLVVYWIFAVLAM